MVDNENDNHENILQNLINISKININEKVFLEDNVLKIDQRIFQVIRRWWHNDSRIETINKIDELINTTFSIIEKINNESNEKNILKLSNSEKMHTYLNGLNGSITGLNNLKITYKNDSSIVTKIEIITNKINNKIKQIQQILSIND